jgi:hypothetical protein
MHRKRQRTTGGSDQTAAEHSSLPQHSESCHLLKVNEQNSDGEEIFLGHMYSILEPTKEMLERQDAATLGQKLDLASLGKLLQCPASPRLGFPSIYGMCRINNSTPVEGSSCQDNSVGPMWAKNFEKKNQNFFGVEITCIMTTLSRLKLLIRTFYTY